MRRFHKVALIALILMSLTGCETRSKLVAKNVYSQPSIQHTPACADSIRSVELRQLTKNSSLALMPVAAILSGGMSVLLAATVNGGITLDDEINANRIAQNEAIIHFQAQKIVSALLLPLWLSADTTACVINDFW